MAYFCYFSFWENLDFPDFLQKKFYNINYRAWKSKLLQDAAAAMPNSINLEWLLSTLYIHFSTYQCDQKKIAKCL